MFLLFSISSPFGKKTNDPILRFEPEGITLLEAYSTCSELFKEKGWYDYCEKLTGYYVEVTKAFVHSFDGEKAEFKSLTL